MPTFSETLATRREPAATVSLPPSAWASSWPKAPREAVALGLRLLSEEETLTCVAESAKEAVAGGRSGQEAVERQNESLLCWVIGYAACDPNDATKPYFAFGDNDVRRALTPEALRRLWDELERATAAASPVTPQATDDDLVDLSILLAVDRPLEGLSPAQEARVRKWLGHIAALLTPLS
jgi:hypothetical protein